MGTELDAATRAAIDVAMRSMPAGWRERWCDPGYGGCACHGCVNIAGGLERIGITKSEWRQWLDVRNREDTREIN